MAGNIPGGASRRNRRAADLPKGGIAIPQERVRSFRYLVAGPTAIPGNRVRLLEDGTEVYPAMLEAIRSAREWVVMESYIFQSGLVGWRFARALMERARAGVRVRLLVDAVGSLGVDARLFDACRDAGVEVREYHPLAPWRPRWAWLARDHRKILVVDGRVGFAGGLNVADVHLSPSEGGEGWHDHALEVHGPAAREMARLFEQGWRKASRWRERLLIGGGSEDIPPRSVPDGPVLEAGDMAVQVVGHQPLLDRYRVRQAYLRAFAQARTSIRLMQCYFLPDRALRNSLRRAAMRGLHVELILPARSDVLLVDLASRYLFSRMLSAGVKIYLWEHGVLHSKLAVVDGVWCAAGSYNLDSMSMAFNLEVSLFVADARLGAEVESRFLRDRDRCRPLYVHEWARRPVWQRLLEYGAYQLRRWL